MAGSGHSGEAGVSATTATGSLLDALDAAAVGLLEPLLGAMLAGDADQGSGQDGHVQDGNGSNEAGTHAAGSDGSWRAGLVEALQRLAQASLALGLIGLAHAVELLRANLLAAGATQDGAPAFAAAESWVSDVIAFCGGQLPASEADRLVTHLCDWPGMAPALTPALVAPIAARLRQDADRIAAATLAEIRARPVGEAGSETGEATCAGGLEQVEEAGQAEDTELPPGRLIVGQDELAMLAEAAEQIGEEFDEAFGAWPPHEAAAALDAARAAPDGEPARAGQAAEALEAAADAIERYANAVGYVGLEAPGQALDVLQHNLQALAREPAAFDARHRGLLQHFAHAWGRLFRELAGPPDAPTGDAGTAAATDGQRVGRASDEALSVLGDSAWPEPPSQALIESARRTFAAIGTVGTRRVTVRDETVGEQELSLKIPLDADRVVVENLLRELPALSHEFSACIERIDAGSDTAIAAAQRIAHTLKGSANTVGVRGIALLTHQLEDLLQLLEPQPGALAAPLRATLSDAADCLAEMSEAVAGLGPAPGNAVTVLSRVREWTRRVLEDPAVALAGARDAAPVPAPVPAPAAMPAQGFAAPAELAHEVPEPGELQEWLRVPASLIERLLAFANEASILLSQAQEQAIEVDRGRAVLRGATDQLQDLAGELERLVDVRGLALSERRAREDFDPLELDEYNDLHMVSRRIAESGADGRLIEQQLGQTVAALRDSLSRLERIQVDVRESALRTRTVRVDTVVPRWRRTVRQAARMIGREVSLQVDGESTEIDAQLLQALVEPVAHLLRNAIDHGIEPAGQRQLLGKPPLGRIVLGFVRDGPDLLIECRDDGAGFDLPAIRARAIALGLLEVGEPCADETLLRWVLMPGFSTRGQATQLSGRGIGLDVVNQAVGELRGTLEIESLPGRGTRFRLRLPVRMAALPVIIVRSGTHVLALSVRDVEQVLAADEAIDAGDGGGPHVNVAAGRLPVVRLEDVLGLPADAFAPPPGVEAGAPALLQVRLQGGERVAVRVPEPGQTRAVVLRPLASFLPPIAGLEGAAALGDGAAAPVFDLPRVLSARQGARALPAARLSLPQAPVCLVVDDSVSVRRTMEQFVRDLGYDVDSAADGVEALEHLKRRVPALVLADLEMPRMNGVELVRALRARPETRSVPVIMITSRSSDKHRALALEAGVDVFLTKPYTEDVLAGHIARLRLSGLSRMR